MTKKIYTGTIAKLIPSQHYGIIESYNHPELYFSFYQVKDKVNVEDKVAYSVKPSIKREGENEGIKATKDLLIKVGSRLSK